jgi:membrane protease YdiL (CAAX protease family)
MNVTSDTSTASFAFDSRSQTESPSKGTPREIGISEILVLHLGPGAIAMAFVLITAPILRRLGYPPDLAITIGVTIVAAVARSGYLLYRGYRVTGTLTFRGAVAPWWRRLPWWQFGGLYALLVAFGLGLYAACAPISQFLSSHLFGWLPYYLLRQWDPVSAEFSRGALLAWVAVLIVFDGVVNPIVEELYFRGHLLSRMLPSLGRWAIVVSAALFALQHFWQPYNAPFLFMFWIAAGSVVVWRRNLGLGMAIHITGNLLGAVLVLVSVVSN